MSGYLLPDHEIKTAEDYAKSGGWRGLEKALSWSPELVIEEIKKSGLRGRGGAGFPTGIKWAGTRQKSSPDGKKYLVCNGAEGEPGTYKDRPLLLLNPYQVIEGVAIASLTIPVDKAFICLKEIFLPQIQRLQDALLECEVKGYLGPNVLKSGRALNVELSIGPATYLYGEETAMLESIMGNPAMPRQVKPFEWGLPFSGGGIASPVVVNNIETLSHVAHIMRNGADWFRSIGTPRSPGNFIWTVSGDVAKPGFYELPMGTTMTRLLEIAGGPKPGRTFKAAFPGGPSCGVLTPDLFDTPLDFDSLKKVDSGLGSGCVIVYDDTACMVHAAYNFSRFFANESCGQCFSCNWSTKEITQRLLKMEMGEGSEDDLIDAWEITERSPGKGRCFLITAESIIVRSILQHFPDEFLRHAGRTCPSPRKLPIPKILDFNGKDFVFDTMDGELDRVPHSSIPVLVPDDHQRSRRI
ncbi:MAG: NADH-ubiquinone oxidoreductase-F iron-sulfur binding region domain-containing protein [Nitrospiria bacterium]